MSHASRTQCFDSISILCLGCMEPSPLAECVRYVVVLLQCKQLNANECTKEDLAAWMS